MPEFVFNRNFYCPLPCEEYIVTDQYQLNEDDIFVTTCPKCGNVVPETKIKGNITEIQRTGPTTEAGKEKVAQNLEGHQGQYKSPEAAARASQNGYKHGRYAKVPRIMAPAKAGAYPVCNGCDFYADCKEGRHSYCPINMEPLLQFVTAYQEGKHQNLREIAGLSQAQLFSMLQMSMQDVFKYGTMVLDETKFGKQHKANPLLARIPDLMDRLGKILSSMN